MLINFEYMRNSRVSIGMIIIAAGFIFSACKTQQHTASSGNNTEELALKKKYSLLLGVKESEITNLSLYKFIDEWYGTPYKSAGKSKTGVDCSGFVSVLYAQIYKKTISGSAATIFESCTSVSEKNLEEGDLVFFKINSDKISHIGVYLKNRRFVHASTHKGVIINSLDEEYYKKYFFKAGRLK